MNYDFVLRKCDPRMGKHLAVLADLLSITSDTINGFPEGTFCEEDYLDALGQLSANALLKFTAESGLVWPPADPSPAELILCQRLYELRETLRERLCGVEESAEREQWEAETAALGVLSDLVYRPGGPWPYSLRTQVEALHLLVAHVNETFGQLLILYPLLQPVLTPLQTLQEVLRTLLLDPAFCPEVNEDLEELDAEADA